MKIITSWKFLAVMILLSTAIIFNLANEQSTSTTETKEIKEVKLATSTLPVAVSGVVESADTVTVYAKTAGVLSTILYKEGDTVFLGDVLAKQDTSVADAQVSLALAQSNLNEVQQLSYVSNIETGNKKAAIQAYSAKEIALLRVAGNNSRLNETTAQTSAAVKASVATVLSVMDYINNNRSLLTAEGLSLYNEAVRLTYGNRSTHFDINLLTSKDNVQNSSTLKTLSESATSSPASISATASLAAQILSLLNDALISAEEDVFDRGEGVGADETEMYLSQKTAVTTALSNLETARGGSKQIIDNTLEDAVTQNQNVEITEVDQIEAKRQAELALDIASYARAVSESGIDVALAQQSLGIITAPFEGVVSKVLAQEGEYVMPGTPILKVVGVKAFELKVTVPGSMIGSLKVGQSFVVNGKEVGVVDRFSPISEGHGHEVVIVLTADNVSVGSTVWGHIQMEPVGTLYKVPRAYVYFTGEGTSIVYKDSGRVKVEIVYDGGDYVFIKTELSKDEALVPAIMIIN
jgi:multidrug efflux pump subunit AcrA (membrane-fusion protein)